MKKHLTVPHQLTERVKLLHKVALEAAGQILLLKRAPESKSRPGKWDLAGGNSEWPHYLEQASLNPHQTDVAREVEEETGVKVSPDHFTDSNLVYFASFYQPGSNIYSINCGWQVTGLPAETKDQIKLSAEHTDYAWIKLEQLNQYDFGGVSRDFETKIIRRVFSKIHLINK